MQTDNQGVPPIVLYGIIAVMAWMLLSKPKEPGPGPVDPPKPKVEQVVSKVFPATKEGYKAVFSDAAAKVTSKELNNEEQLSTFLKKGLENARGEASVDFDKLLDDNLPSEFGGREDAVSTFLREVAAGW